MSQLSLKQIIAADPELGTLKSLYVKVFGVPISGLRIRLRHVFEHIQSAPARVVDFGCGRGAFAYELAIRFPNSIIVGIDSNRRQIEINRKLAEQFQLRNVQFVEGDLLHANYQSDCDLALSIDNLEHIEDHGAALRVIFNALKPGGKLVCHVPAARRWWIFRELRPNFDAPGHVRPGYELSEIRELLQQTGFVVDEANYSFTYLETISNNLSYLVTRAEQRNAWIYALVFPLLSVVSWLGGRGNGRLGSAGIICVAHKPV